MADKNYTEACEVCGNEYAPTLNKDGSPRKTKYKLCGARRCGYARSYSASIGTTNRIRAQRQPKKADCGTRLLCSVGGCEKHVEAGGMCAMHYQRVRAHGDPSKTSRGKRVQKACEWCGELMRLKPGEVKRRKCCSTRCASFYGARVRGQIIHGSKKAQDSFYSAKRRAATSTKSGVSINPIKVFERDKWKCHMCGVKTLKSLRGTYEARAPELEHIVPLSQGGTHSWGNVACSCRACNAAKGATAVGQIGFDFSV